MRGPGKVYVPEAEPASTALGMCLLEQFFTEYIDVRAIESIRTDIGVSNIKISSGSNCTEGARQKVKSECCKE